MTLFRVISKLIDQSSLAADTSITFIYGGKGYTLTLFGSEFRLHVAGSFSDTCFRVWPVPNIPTTYAAVVRAAAEVFQAIEVRQRLGL